MPDDYKSVLSINHVYQIPLGRDRKYLTQGVLSYILGDWNLSGIWTAQTGPHFTAILGTNVSNSAGGGNQRPNRIGNGNLAPDQRSIYHWFDTGAFAPPPPFTFGNSGTGILVGPGYFDVDLSMVRQFRITERFRLDLRSEWFNAFNRANFNSPNASIQTAQAGVISSTLPSRIIQMAVKVSF